MTDEAISAAPSGVFQDQARSVYRALLWNLFQLASIGGFALVAASAPVWPPSSPVLMAAFAAMLLPQIATTWNLVRVDAPAPGLPLWLSTLATFAAAFAFVQWPITRDIDPNAAIIAAAFFAFATPYLALWFSTKQWEAKDSRRWLTQAINLVAVSHILTLAALYVASKYWSTFVPGPWSVLALAMLIVLQPTVANLAQALLDKRLPVRPGAKPELKHISGLGAISLSLFVISIIALGFWAATRANGAFISQDAGAIVVIGLGVAFLLVAIGPNLRAGDQVVQTLRDTGPVKGIGGIVSTIDGILVFAVAGSVGVSQERASLRYFLLIAHLVAAALFGWWLPSPFGLIPIFWALLCSMSVARRWAWIEEDRENAMLNRKFSGDHIKVGFDQDLRDEALLGFTSLLLLVPLFLRQIHVAYGGDLFEMTDANITDDFFAWLTFFGTELAKAVPFVDWAEVYQVRGDAPIHVDDTHIGAAQHVIFATRILVDLVILGTLVQAIAVAQRASKLKEMFYNDRTLDRLDPFTEAKAFKGLVSGERGHWQLIEPAPAPFLGYDEDRLEELQVKHEGDVIGYAAGELLARRTPELLLVEEAKRATPNSEKIEVFLDRSRARGDAVSIADLKAAHYFLATAAKLRSVREEIVGVIGEHWRVAGAIDAIVEILISPAARDPRYEVRLAALHALFIPAANGRRTARTAIRMAREDGAQAVRTLASRWVDEHPDWYEE